MIRLGITMKKGISTMYCNSCGNIISGEPQANYFCSECKDTKGWPIDRKYCAGCGKEFGYVWVDAIKDGMGFKILKREGNFFCRSCKDNKKPKYNTKKADIDALVHDVKPKYSIIEIAYRQYVPVKDSVVVVYECACETVDKVNHHYDYSRPLEVVRLCRQCHRREHGRLYTLRKMKVSGDTK